MSELLKAKDVSIAFSYGTQTHLLLQEINLTVFPGEKVILMGRSGSGKTTLIQILAGLSHPTQGTVQISGSTVSTMSEQEKNAFRSQKLGFMFQKHHFISDFSVIENVALPLLLNKNPQALQQAEVMLLQLNIPPKLFQQSPKQLSMGEQARIALARALIHHPSLLFMDEPSASLDDPLTQEIFGYIEKLHKQYKFAMVVATHDQSLLKFADRVYDLRNGKLEARDA